MERLITKLVFVAYTQISAHEVHDGSNFQIHGIVIPHENWFYHNVHFITFQK